MTTAKQTRKPGRPPAGSEDKRARILLEAQRLFAVRGYAATSINDIAQAAELSKAGLLHHFPSKDDLLAAVLQARDEQVLQRFDFEQLSARDMMETWTRIVLDNSHAPQEVAVYVAMTPSILDKDHPAGTWYRGHIEAALDMAIRVLERGIQRGELQAGTPVEAVARSLVAVSDGIQIQWLAERTRLYEAGASDAEVAARIEEIAATVGATVEALVKAWVK